jgi:hypothetical protein
MHWILAMVSCSRLCEVQKVEVQRAVPVGLFELHMVCVELSCPVSHLPACELVLLPSS